MDRSTLQRIVIVGGGTAGNHLKEEESKFFQVAGRLLSATKKKQLARKYAREIVRMRRHYATESARPTNSTPLARGRMR